MSCFKYPDQIIFLPGFEFNYLSFNDSSMTQRKSHTENTYGILAPKDDDPSEQI